MTSPVFDHEVWRIVEGFGGRYRVSSHGRVKVFDSASRHDDTCLVPYNRENGLTVSLRTTSRHTERFVARLVLMAFRPIKHAHLKRVVYENGDPTDCRLCNLSWGDRYGASHGRSKLTDDDVKTIRANYKPPFERHKDIARRYGVSQSRITDILNGFAWTHIE